MAGKGIRVRPGSRIINGSVRPGASKSISNRLLIIRSLSSGNIEIENLSDASDTKTLVNLLEHKGDVYDAKDAGTVFRFMLAYLSCREGVWILRGTSRLLERPILPLVQALKGIGAEISFSGEEGKSAIKIRGKKLKGGTIILDPSESSQFVSALLMIAPTLEMGLNIKFSSPPVSEPYIKMTCELMKRFGVEVIPNENGYEVKPGFYKGGKIRVEADWSSAAFWYETVCLSSKAELFVEDLHEDSLQGDSVIRELAYEFGVETIYTEKGALIKKDSQDIIPEIVKFDFNETPDLFPAISAICAGKKVKALFSGIRNLSRKESDRLESMCSAFTQMKASCKYDIENDLFQMNGIPVSYASDTLTVMNDHRIAMALAPLSLITGEINLDDREVVDKSYPGFWEELSKLGFVFENL